MNRPSCVAARWVAELEQWFDDGPDSDEIVLIRVSPGAVTFWNGEETGE